MMKLCLTKVPSLDGPEVFWGLSGGRFRKQKFYYE